MILAPDGPGLERAARLIREGSVVAMPTETVYGLAADAFNPLACAKVFEIKGRPAFDPLIVHLADASRLGDAAEPNALALRLAEAFWPGPLTLVLPRRRAVPGIVTAGLDTVAVRVPAHPVARALLRLVDRPLAAPSANRFGGLSPTRAEHVEASLGERVACVLDGGPCSVGVESTIVDLSGPQPRLLRPGGLPVERLEALLGHPLEAVGGSQDRPLAPGQLKSHYAPRTRLRLLPGPSQGGPGAPGRVGLLAFRAAPTHPGHAAVEILSPSGDLAEAAARLFECLHRLDARDLDLIEAEPVPTAGLGLAISDRLERAAA